MLYVYFYILPYIPTISRITYIFPYCSISFYIIYIYMHTFIYIYIYIHYIYYICWMICDWFLIDFEWFPDHHLLIPGVRTCSECSNKRTCSCCCCCCSRNTSLTFRSDRCKGPTDEGGRSILLLRVFEDVPVVRTCLGFSNMTAPRNN